MPELVRSARLSDRMVASKNMGPYHRELRRLLIYLMKPIPRLCWLVGQKGGCRKFSRMCRANEGVLEISKRSTAEHNVTVAALMTTSPPFWLGKECHNGGFVRSSVIYQENRGKKLVRHENVSVT
jgi:hypothetical protein